MLQLLKPKYFIFKLLSIGSLAVGCGGLLLAMTLFEIYRVEKDYQNLFLIPGAFWVIFYGALSLYFCGRAR